MSSTALKTPSSPVVPQGYKQTEVGVIPEDWEVAKLGDYATFRTGPFGSALHKSDYVANGVPVINPMQIVDGKLVPTPTMSITERAADMLNEFRLPVGSVVIGRRGEMGRCAFVGKEQHGWLCGTGSMIVRPAKTLDGRYLQRIMSSPLIVRAIENNSVGTTMINLNQSTLSGLSIPLPSTELEQQAIAEALSDADELIEGLESLIAKKRQVKQGAMLELMTPGVDWEEKVLGNTATLKARIGWQGLTTGEYLDDGSFYLVTGTDFAKGRIDWANCHYVEEKRYKQDTYIQLRPHDVLVTKDGTIGKVALVDHLDKPATLNSGVFVIRPINESFYPDFFFYILRSKVFVDFLNQLSAGSTINHLYQKDFVKFTFKVPNSLKEQKRITAILADMDTDISSLEAKLNKARQVKEGMMQDLLTGKVRLV